MFGHCIITSPSNCFCQGCNRLLGIFEIVPVFKLLTLAAAQARYIDVSAGHVYKGCKNAILAIVNILPNLVSNQPASCIIAIIAISLDKFYELLSHVIATWNFQRMIFTLPNNSIYTC